MGKRAELEVENPKRCPVAAASAETDEPVDSVSWTRDGETVVEEFAAPGDTMPGDVSGVFESRSRQFYRFTRPSSGDCWYPRLVGCPAVGTGQTFFPVPCDDCTTDRPTCRTRPDPSEGGRAIREGFA